jgi:hypothetical protein
MEVLPAYPSRASGTMQGKPGIDGRVSGINPAPTISYAPESPRAPSASPGPGSRTSIGLGAGTTGSGITGRFSRASLRPSIDAARNTLRTVRQTLLSVLPPLPMSKSAWYGPVATLGMLVVSLFGLGWWLWSTGRMPETVSSVLRLPPSPKRAMVVPAAPAEEPEPEVADVKFGRGSVLGGILAIPTSFAPAPDGAFDLIIHSHGNTDLAVESYEAVGTGAAVFVLNLGVGSGAYEDRFTHPKALDEAIQRATKGVTDRGIANAHVRRLAMVGWSAGYGSALRAVAHPQHADRIDAILLLDGLHAGYRAGTRKIEPVSVEPMLRYAERAVKGEKLLVITHSNIDPVDYLGVKETTNWMLEQLQIERAKVEGTTTLPILRAMEGVLPRAEMVGLEKRTEARKGGLVVRGYAGHLPTHHISHLMQMSQTALPLLVEHWREVP